MQHDPRPDPESQVLPEQAAKRLLERASELDAARANGSAVAQLRAVAQEAGISRSAFDAALAELSAADDATPVATPSKRGWWSNRTALLTLGVIALLLGAFALMRLFPPAGPPTIAREFRVTCTTPRDAADLIRPLTDGQTTQIVIPPAGTSRSLRVVATPSDMDRIAEMLKRLEGPTGAGCSVPLS